MPGRLLPFGTPPFAVSLFSTVAPAPRFVYSTLIAPPPPDVTPQHGCMSPPFASSVPAPLRFVAVIQTEPPAPLPLLTAPFARIAPSWFSVAALIRTMPPPDGPLAPLPPPASRGR